ncbi:MAG: SDR family NAD(P)-dependent oxidoreductase [Candidatus Nanopelagicales bacterium]
MRDLNGRRVLVTGGARGIGLAIAERFALEGAALVLTDLDGPGVEVAAARLRERGVDAVGYQLDVTDEAAILALRDRLGDEVGPIDVLVNNAGTVFGGPFEQVPMGRHRLTYEVNTIGVVAMTHAFLPELIGRPEAHIVVISSASALVGVPFGSTYASSKWGALGFGESLRLELKQRGLDHVGVTTVCPSFVSSGLFDGSTPPRLTQWLTPEKLADQVLTGVRRDRSLVLTPWLVNLTPVLRGLLPPRVYDWAADLFGVTRSMASWHGHAAGQGGPAVERIVAEADIEVDVEVDDEGGEVDAEVEVDLIEVDR